MLVLLFAFAHFLRAVQASAFPSLTSFGNATTVAPSGAAVTGCVRDCTLRAPSDLYYVSWSRMSITATYTAETLWHIVNNRTNSTRTSTIKNTEINFNNISTPTSTNAAGTVTASFINKGEVLSAVYPTNVFEDYESTYSFCGTLPTIINGDPTCLRNPCTTGSVIDNQAGIYTYPAHPPVPISTQTNADMAQDPRGWTYVPTIERQCGNSWVHEIFPNLGVWSCKVSVVCVAPVGVLETALYLTATSTSHEADTPSPQATSAPPTSLKPDAPPPPINTPISSPTTPDNETPQAPVALTLANALPLLSTDTPSPAPAAANKPEDAPAPAPAPAHASQPPPPPQAATNAPATSLPPPIQQAPGNAANVPPKQPPLAANPSPPNQQPSSNAPAPNQEAPGNAAITPPKQSAPAASPPAATIIPIAVTSTNEQGIAVISTTPVPVIPVLHSTTNAQGSVAVSTSFSQLKANAPITLVPQPITSTNAQSSVIISSSYAVAIPVLITTTNAQGQPLIAISTGFSPTPTNVPPTPLALIPTIITTTNAQGSTTVSPATAAIIPIAITTTNAAGQLIVSTSLSTSPLTATANILLTTTNAQGIVVPFTTNVPAIILTPTNAQGSQIITTSPLLPVTTQAPLITVGNQVVTANSEGQYIIGSQTLTAGGAVIISGTPVSLAPGYSQVVVGSSTEGLAMLTTAGLGKGPGGGAGGTEAPLFTIGSQAFTANSEGQYVIGSQTLTAGGAVTVSGTPVSLAPGETQVVVGSSTEGLAGLITAGFGEGPGGNGNGSVVAFTGGGGAAADGGRGRSAWIAAMVVLVVLGM
ncbi:hypothetical protein N7G274_002229 [Stereocaulon virgatum]|uniref:Uncharacterized protein n=1 Tax=Stereocaulon virgatum TaxID=373712 RepID=A0ABR4AHA2_9LECA